MVKCHHEEHELRGDPASIRVIQRITHFWIASLKLAMTIRLMLLSLKSKSEFSEVSNEGKKHVARYFIILIQKIEDKNNAYLGLKISKKIGNAVTRNKVRRRFKHLIRNLVKENSDLAGHRFLIIPKRTITSASYSELLQAFEKLF